MDASTAAKRRPDAHQDLDLPRLIVRSAYGGLPIGYFDVSQINKSPRTRAYSRRAIGRTVMLNGNRHHIFTLQSSESTLCKPTIALAL